MNTACERTPASRVSYGRLNRDARDLLRWYGEGVTIAGYVRQYDPDGVWRGDACGCLYDRCIGDHHDADEECGCLRGLVEEYAADLAKRIVAGDSEKEPKVTGDQWTTRDVAAYTGKKESTIRAYHARGQMPAPDGRVSRTPWWKPETIKAWR